jgi:Flp pilus assembly protein TadB
MFAVLVFLVVFAAGVTLWVRRSSFVQETPEQVKAWQRAVQDSSQLGRILLSTSRPLAKLPSIHGAGESRQYRQLTRKLQSAQVFAGNVEVFLAYQMLAIIGAVAILAGVLIGADSSSATLIGVLAAVSLTALPYNEVSKASKRREDAVTASLPEFAELLRMPLAAGVGVLEALRFTAARTEGVVSQEVQRMLKVRQTGVADAQAFQEAGVRLGTPQAEAFFLTLLNGVTGGAKTVQQIGAQADELRQLEFQRRRARGKQLPVKMIGAMAAHFMPLLFIVVTLPTLFSLGSL